jgi:hypothetical protein
MTELSSISGCGRWNRLYGEIRSNLNTSKGSTILKEDSLVRRLLWNRM